MSDKIKVFLCYAKEDLEKVEELYNKLKEEGFDPWLDTEKLLPGQKWEPEIKKAIKSSDFFIACLSKESVENRGFRHREIARALEVLEEQPEGEIYLIPAHLEDCDVPDSLGNLHRVDVYTERGFKKLLESLNTKRTKSTDQTKPTKSKSNILINAARDGNTTGVQALLDKGTDANAKDRHGYRVLMKAAFWGHTAIVQALLDKGADVNAKDKNGMTAFMWAAKAGHTAIVQNLLAKGADVNAKTKRGGTALMKAAYAGHTETVQALLANGADVNAKTEDGTTALVWATEKGRTEVIKLLKQHGAKE